MSNKQNIQTQQANTETNDFCPVDAVVGLPTINVNEITLGDSLELCERIPAKTVDLILEDMPYNTTACEWDVKIDLELYWKTRLRILKPTGAIVLTASQPFTSMLVMSNRKIFKYEWIWDKVKPSSFLTAKIEPLRKHESILIFGNTKIIYNPIMIKGRFRNKTPIRNGKDGVYGSYTGNDIQNFNDENYPKSIIEWSNADQTEKEHPTQKPVGLFEYLIRTYSNENDLVFDGFGGSGTTAIACHKSKRNFIVIEKEQKYFDLATRRLDDERRQLSLL